jgi:PAS domain S-box-containing protein
MPRIENPRVSAMFQELPADLFNTIPSPLLLLDKAGIILDANQEFQKVFGLSVESIGGSYFLDMLAIDAEAKDLLKKKSAANPDVIGMMGSETRWRMVSGKGLWVKVNSRVFRHDNREYSLLFINDISEQMKALEDARIAAERIKSFFDNAKDLVHSIAPDGKILYVNRVWQQTLGYSSSEVAELNMVDILRDDQVGQYLAIMARVKKGEEFEFIDTIFRTKNGQDLIVEGNIRCQYENGRFMAALCVFRDVTYKRSLEETYSSLIMNSPTAMYVVQNRLFRFVNPSFMVLTGYTEKDLLGRESLSLVFSQDKNQVSRSAVNSLKSRRPKSYEFRLLTKEGEIRWVMETVISIPYEGGRAALGTVVDISDHKMFEKALEEAHARYLTLFNSAGDAIYIHDNTGRFLEVNDAACQMLSYSRAELLKQNIKTFFFRHNPSGLQNYLDEVSHNRVFFADTQMAARNGRIIPVEINCKLVNYNSQPAVLGVARDISERKQIELIRAKNQVRTESLVRISEFAPNNTQDLLNFALTEMLKLAESQYGFFYDYAEKSGQLKLLALSGELNQYLMQDKSAFACRLESCGILGEAIRQKKPIIIPNLQSPQMAANGFPEGRYRIKNYLAVPVWSDNQIRGLAVVANKAQDYDASDVQQLSLMVKSVWNLLGKIEAEKTLADSEQRYRQLIDLSQDGILRLDRIGKIVMANPAACRMFGYAEQDLVDQHMSITVIPQEQTEANLRWVQLTGDQPARFERQAVRKDGTHFPMEVSVSPLSHGYFQEVVRDISDRKQMEFQLHESEKKYRQIVENQSDLISETTPDGHLKFLNSAYLTLLGEPLEKLLGRHVGELMHPDDIEPGGKNALAALVPPYTAYSENRIRTKNGWRWIAWTLNGVLDQNGEISSVSGIGRDITESKQAKEDLEQANLRLRELDKLKDNFLSTVSHELRTPLTSIKSFTEILLNYEEDQKTQKEFLGIINEESDRLTRLINDFLDISKIQAGRMQWKTQAVSLSEVISQAVNSARPLVEKENLELKTEVEKDLPTVMADQDRLVQVVTNLLGNAVKFTPRGGQITLKAWQNRLPGNSDKKMLYFSITDSGIGIAPENQSKIFENFGQVGDVLKDRPKGTGLGLPISKKIIEAFGGKIWVESSLGKGSTFLFNLPLTDKLAEVTQPPA